MSTLIFRAKLAEHCTREYGWSLSHSNKHVKEFCDKFLPIKRFLKDYDGTICAASPILDQVWEIAESMKGYESICGKKMFVRREEESCVEQEEKTLEAYRDLFGELLNGSVWSFPSNENKENEWVAVKNESDDEGPRKRRRVIDSDSLDYDSETEEADYDSETEQEDVKEEENHRHDPSDPYTKERVAAIQKSLAERKPAFYIEAEPLTKKRIRLNVSPEYLVEEIRVMIMNHNGIPPFQLRLVCNGKMLEDGFSLGEYGVQAGSVVHLVVRLIGC